MSHRFEVELNRTTVVFGIALLLAAGLGYYSQSRRAHRPAAPVAVVVTATAPPTPGWQLNFDDEFDGKALDTTRWIDSYPDGVRTHSNGEQQYYGTDSYAVHDGYLYLKARRQKQDDKPYTSAMIASYEKFQQRYGRFEMRAELPKGRGLWPAFWLLPASGDWPPEIDAMEVLGDKPGRIYMSNHWKDDSGKHIGSTTPWDGPDFSTGFHVFRVDWSPDAIVWYVDGVERNRLTTHIPDVPMYVIANLAVGGDWPGSPDTSTHFPAEMVIDYIRVYSR